MRGQIASTVNNNFNHYLPLDVNSDVQHKVLPKRTTDCLWTISMNLLSFAHALVYFLVIFQR